MKWLHDAVRRVARDANVAASINVAKGDGAHASVHRHQRVVQRNGRTTVVTEEVHTSRKETRHDGEE